MSIHLRSENDKVNKLEKCDKIHARILSKANAQPHIMKKTHAKFQNELYKTV